MKESFSEKGSVASEALSLIWAYAKQETLGPLKTLGRYLAFSLLGGLLLGLGMVAILLGVLRFLQSESGTAFGGHLSWLPYLITLLIGVVLGGGAARLMKSRGSR